MKKKKLIMLKIKITPFILAKDDRMEIEHEKEIVVMTENPYFGEYLQNLIKNVYFDKYEWVKRPKIKKN